MRKTSCNHLTQKVTLGRKTAEIARRKCKERAREINWKRVQKGDIYEISSTLSNSVFLCFKAIGIKKNDGRQLPLQTVCESL